MRVTCDLSDESRESKGAGGESPPPPPSPAPPTSPPDCGSEGPGQNGVLATGLAETEGERQAEEESALGPAPGSPGGKQQQGIVSTTQILSHTTGRTPLGGADEALAWSMFKSQEHQRRRSSLEEVEARALSMFAAHQATPRATAQTRTALRFFADWDDSDAHVAEVEREGISSQEEYACLVGNHRCFNGVHM